MSAIQELINEAKRQGFDVYGPETLTSYFYVTKDDKIGYCQFDRITGAAFATVHKPNRYTGTGYRVDNFEQSIMHRAPWASSGESIVKYASLDEFRRKHWQPLSQY